MKRSSLLPFLMLSADEDEVKELPGRSARIDVADESMTGVLGKGLGVDERRAEQLKMQKGLQNISKVSKVYWLLFWVLSFKK